MEALANRGKYKVIDRLESGGGYEAFTAVDIEARERAEVLVNRYGDPETVRRLLPLFFEARERGCPGLVELFTDYGRFAAVFRAARGAPLRAAVKRGLSHELRRELEERMFLQAIALSQLPLELQNSLLCEENILVELDSRRVSVQMRARPERFQRGDAAVLELGKLSECLLGRRFCSMRAELEFLDALRTGSYRTVGAAYAAWRALCDRQEEWKAYNAKNAPARLFYGLVTWLRRRKGGRALRARYRY